MYCTCTCRGSKCYSLYTSWIQRNVTEVHLRIITLELLVNFTCFVHTVNCFIFVVTCKIISFTPLRTKLSHSNILLHWKFSQWIFRRMKVFWHGLLSSLLACVMQCPCRWCSPVATQGMSLYHYFKLGMDFRLNGSLSRSVSCAIIHCSFCQLGGAKSDRRHALTHCLPWISGCQVPLKVGSLNWKSWLQEAFVSR